MTHVNVHVPTAEGIRREQRLRALEEELSFWKAKAEELHNNLENIYSHAKKHGHVEVHHRGDKLDLHVAETRKK